VLFHPLGLEELGVIVGLQIDLLAKRLRDRRLTLEVTPAARDWLALGGFDPVYGARPLRRLVQTSIGDQLAKAILSGEVVDGDTVVVDVAVPGDRLTVRGSSTPVVDVEIPLQPLALEASTYDEPDDPDDEGAFS